MGRHTPATFHLLPSSFSFLGLPQSALRLACRPHSAPLTFEKHPSSQLENLHFMASFASFSTSVTSPCRVHVQRVAQGIFGHQEHQEERRPSGLHFNAQPPCAMKWPVRTTTQPPPCNAWNTVS